MQKYSIEIEDNVYEDIANIANYLYKQTFSRELASKIYDLLFASIYSLQVFPYRFQIEYKNYHVINIKSYKIFYKIEKDFNLVKIYRVFWSKQNYKNLIT